MRILLFILVLSACGSPEDFLDEMNPLTPVCECWLNDGRGFLVEQRDGRCPLRQDVQYPGCSSSYAYKTTYTLTFEEFLALPYKRQLTPGGFAND
jgi:hypothetical protein